MKTAALILWIIAIALWSNWIIDLMVPQPEMWPLRLTLAFLCGFFITGRLAQYIVDRTMP